MNKTKWNQVAYQRNLWQVTHFHRWLKMGKRKMKGGIEVQMNENWLGEKRKKPEEI